MKRLLVVVVLSCLFPAAAAAKLISVSPSDSYTKIEAAKPGDIVEIAPGTYKFRVHLTGKGTASNPIIIRAQDPSKRPVWDLSGKPVKDWPGSYSLGDRGRGCWQVTGDHYKISGIVFKNCQDITSAGVRAVNSGPLTISHCLFANNTNGLTGASTKLLVEFSEFDSNGKLTTTGDTSHNISISGGAVTLRYSYVHDAVDGQNLNLRAREAIIEYNWIARPKSYTADLMTCERFCGGTGTGAITQTLVLRGNVIIQGQPKNTYKLMVLYNDNPAGSSDKTGVVSAMDLTMEHNTIIGTYTMSQRMVELRNDGVDTKAHLSNNIVYQQYELVKPHTATKTNWSVDGKNNWVTTGTKVGTLTGTITGSDPGFTNVLNRDYTLTAASACKGKAATLTTPPSKEYYKDEKTVAMYRPRATANDIGAFEQGNAATPVGPIVTKPKPDGGVPDGGADGPTATVEAGAEASVDGPAGDSGSPDSSIKPDSGKDDDDDDDDEGCSCATSSPPGSGSAALLLLLVSLLATRRRRS